MIFYPRKQEGICDSLGLRKKISHVRQIWHKKKTAVDKKRNAKQSKAKQASKQQWWCKATAIKPSTGGGGGGDICSKPDTSTTLVPN
jgi:hypothetical protein